MSKCIKCGRELTSAEIPEFYNGMCEKCYKEKNYAEYPFKQGINDYQNQIDQLKQQLAEKDKEIERLNTIIGLSQLQVSEKDRLNTSVNINSLQYNQKLLAIQELEKVNGILTDTIIEVTQNEFELNKLCYLEEISAKFYEKMQEQIKELKGE